LNVFAGQRAKVGTSHKVLEFHIAPHRTHGAFLDGIHARETVVFVQGLVLVCGKGGGKVENGGVGGGDEDSKVEGV